MTPAQSQAADHFYLGVIALLALIVLVMLGLVCIWRLVWLVAEARQARRVVSDDPQQEYRERSGYSVDWRERRRQAMECRRCVKIAAEADEIERVVAEFRADLDRWATQ